MTYLSTNGVIYLASPPTMATFMYCDLSWLFHGFLCHIYQLVFTKGGDAIAYLPPSLEKGRDCVVLESFYQLLPACRPFGCHLFV